jgi:membrane-bound metal-dependent hydrolase YbcI (DUF457 family)
MTPCQADILRPTARSRCLSSSIYRLRSVIKMMGVNHVRLGAVFALAAAASAAQLGGILFAPDLLLAVSQASGYALLPDIDHRTSIATKSFEPVTVPLHWLTVWFHRIVYTLTRRGDDPPSRLNSRPKPRVGGIPGFRWATRSLFGYARPWRSAHRGITHSIISAAVLSGLVCGLMYAGPLWAIGVILAGVALGGSLVFAAPVIFIYAAAVFISFGPAGALDHLVKMSPLWATSMFLGLASHVFGDGCTKSGSPVWAPVTWRTYRTPLYFKTNKWFEQNVMKWVLLGLVAYFTLVLVNQYFHGAVIALLSGLAHAFGIGR